MSWLLGQIEFQGGHTGDGEPCRASDGPYAVVGMFHVRYFRLPFFPLEILGGFLSLL